MTEEIDGSIYLYIFSNGKKYVGLTTHNPEKRKNEHLSCSRNMNPKYLVHKAIKLYGEDSFEMIILVKSKNKDELKSLEINYIQEHNTYFENGLGYNMTLGGEGMFGYKFSDEIKLKMSRIRKEILKNNPQIIEKWKESMKNYWTEEKKNELSLLKKEQFKNNPELSKQISERQTIRGNTLEGKKRGDPKSFDVHNLNGEYIATYDFVPYAVNDLINEKKLLNDITENSLGKSIRRVLLGERNHTKGFTFKYI